MLAQHHLLHNTSRASKGCTQLHHHNLSLSEAGLRKSLSLTGTPHLFLPLLRNVAVRYRLLQGTGFGVLAKLHRTPVERHLDSSNFTKNIWYDQVLASSEPFEPNDALGIVASIVTHFDSVARRSPLIPTPKRQQLLAQKHSRIIRRRNHPKMDQQEPITAEWCQKMDMRLKWLKWLGVVDKIALHRDPDGLPCYDGMPLERDTFLAPPNNIPGATVPTTTLAPASQVPSDPSIRISSDQFQQIVEDLQSRSAYTHVAWAVAVLKLQLMHERTPSALNVFDTLKSALEACKSDLNAVTTLSGTSAPMDFLTKEPQVRTWLAPLQCRLIGIQVEPNSSATWWEDHGRTAVGRFNDDSLYRCIDYTNNGVVQISNWYHGNSLFSRLPSRTLMEGVIPNIKRFLQMQQNGGVLAKIEQHITQLRTDMQQAAEDEDSDEMGD